MSVSFAALDSHKPFNNNLRIMSFSNIMGKIHPSYYVPETDLYSENGINNGFVVGSKKIILDYASDRTKEDMYGGMMSIHKLIELKRREVEHENNLLIDVGGSLVPPLNSNESIISDITSMHIDMSVDVMSIGYELLMGKKHIEDIASNYATSRVSILSTNLSEGDEYLFNPYKEYKFHDHNVVVFGVSATFINDEDSPIAVTPKFANLKKMVDFFKKDNYLIIVASSNSLEYNTLMAKNVPGISIILGGADKLPLPHPVYVVNDSGSVLITTSGGDGNFLSILDLDLSSNDIDNFKYNIVSVNSDDIDAELYNYTLHNSVKISKPVDLLKTKKTLKTGNFYPKDLDLMFMHALKSHNGADIVIGSPPMTNVSIKSGSFLTEDDINTYFFNKNHRLVESHLTGELIQSILNNYFNKKLFKTPHRRLVRTFGIDYTIERDYPTFKITIQSINGVKFNKNKKYKLVGWGDITNEDKSNEFIESHMLNIMKEYKQKNVIFKDKIKINY